MVMLLQRSVYNIHKKTCSQYTIMMSCLVNIRVETRTCSTQMLLSILLIEKAHCNLQV